MTQALEQIEGEEVDREIVGDNSALAILNKSEIDMQISTAKKYPRSIAASKRRMVEMATLNQDIAKSCNYALKRSGKRGKISWIEGPSIRLAEIAVSCWGNIRYGGRIVSEDDRFITAQGVCHDLETNVYSMMETRRRITDRSGRKYSDDMVAVTGNAAAAIAARNAVFKVIPKAIVDEAAKAAERVACGEGKTFDQVRTNALAEFAKLDVSIDQIMVVLDKPGRGREDLDSTDLRRMLGLLTAIKDGDASVESLFGAKEPATKPPSAGTQKLNEHLDGKTPPTNKQSNVADQAPKTAGPAVTVNKETGEIHPLQELYDQGAEAWEKALLADAKKATPAATTRVLRDAISKMQMSPMEQWTIDNLADVFGRAAKGLDMVHGAFKG